MTTISQIVGETATRSLGARVSRGWTSTGRHDVPDGGVELLNLLRSYGATANDDPDDVADALTLDSGLVRYALTRLDREVDEQDQPVPLPTVKNEALAGDLLVLAARVAPLTMDRAKRITRMSGDVLEDVLDALVVAGMLLRQAGEVRAWGTTS